MMNRTRDTAVQVPTNEQAEENGQGGREIQRERAVSADEE